MAWAFKQTGLDTNAKFVLIAICCTGSGGPNELFRPSMANLQEITCLSKKSVLAALRYLRDKNLILLEINRQSDGAGRPFVVHIPELRQ